MSYKRELVERLIPAIWDEGYAYGMRNPYAPDADMPKGSVDKKSGSPLYAHLADIKSAWARTSLKPIERQVLLLRFGLDYTQNDVAQVLGTTRRVVEYAAQTGVGRLTAYLNGDSYEDADDDE